MKNTCRFCKGVDGVDGCEVTGDVCADCYSDHEVREYDRYMER